MRYTNPRTHSLTHSILTVRHNFLDLAERARVGSSAIDATIDEADVRPEHVVVAVAVCQTNDPPICLFSANITCIQINASSQSYLT